MGAKNDDVRNGIHGEERKEAAGGNERGLRLIIEERLIKEAGLWWGH